MAGLDKTIISYSACTEAPEFEARIRDDLRRKADALGIPIISVTRKPVDLGTNICVGEQPVCYMNEWRQLLIGLKAAKTRFCQTAEADCLYPESYFEFVPPVANMIYFYDNIYIVWKYHNGFWQKTGHCEGAEICGREYWIGRLEPILAEYGDEWVGIGREAENRLVRTFFPTEGLFTGDPVISFKTRDGVSSRTTFVNKKVYELPYWGRIEKVKEIFT
jgi:hypothetical protein